MRPAVGETPCHQVPLAGQFVAHAGEFGAISGEAGLGGLDRDLRFFDLRSETPVRLRAR